MEMLDIMQSDLLKMDIVRMMEGTCIKNIKYMQKCIVSNNK